MTPLAVTLALLALLLASGIPIFVAVGGAATVGLMLAGQPLDAAAHAFLSTVSNFALIAIPLFVFMAELMSSNGMIEGLVRLLNAFVGHWRGGLGHVAVLASAIFAAFSGSSAANAAALSISLIPQMKRTGYTPRFAAGLVAAGGTLGILIPPSINMILYSAVTGLPVLDLFRAGLLPGFMLAGFFLVVVAVVARRQGIERQPYAAWPERRALLREMGPLLLLPGIVLGSIYSGMLTVNESAVSGIAFALALQILWFRSFSWVNVVHALVRTAKTTSMIYLIIGTAAMFGHVLALSQAAHAVAGAVTPVIEYSSALFLALTVLLLVALGMFIDVAAITYIVVPILDMTLMLHGFDRVRFAIVFVITMELGLITPPFGLNTFIASSASKVPINEVFKGAIPFCLAMLAAIMVVALVPWLTR